MPAGSEYLLWRRALADGRQTTLYAIRHPRRETRVRVVHFPETERLDLWCAANEVDEAIIGGFFLRDPYRPLGDLWIGGRAVPHEDILPPYDASRACVIVDAQGPAGHPGCGDGGYVDLGGACAGVGEALEELQR